MVDKKEIVSKVFSTLPSSIMVAFGDPLSKVAGFFGLISKGMEWFIEKNKEWWESYITEEDAIFLIDDQIKSAEYIQFIRKILINIAYEKSELKREHFRKFALNYSKMRVENKFDDVIYYELILERLNESHLNFIIFMTQFKQVSGGKEHYAPLPLNQFERNTFANGPFKDKLKIPFHLIEPIVNDLANLYIIERRPKQNFLLFTEMGDKFIDYLIK